MNLMAWKASWAHRTGENEKKKIIIKLKKIGPNVECVCSKLMLTSPINTLIMPPTLKTWGTYWFRLVRMYVCVYVYMYSCSRYRLETSCMDSSWENSRPIFLVFPELFPLVKLRPFDKQRDEIL